MRDKLWAQMNENRFCFIWLFVYYCCIIKIWTCAPEQVIWYSFGSGMVSAHWNHWTAATYGLNCGIWFIHAILWQKIESATRSIPFWIYFINAWSRKLDGKFCHHESDIYKLISVPNQPSKTIEIPFERMKCPEWINKVKKKWEKEEQKNHLKIERKKKEKTIFQGHKARPSNRNDEKL